MCLPVQSFKIEKEWEFAGLKCAVVQARENRHRCGYVRVPPNHSMYNKDYDTPNVSVHGGLTFAQLESCVEEDGIGYWYGFDCAHSSDAMFDPKSIDDYKDRQLLNCLGDHYWSHDEVVAETEKLALQLAGMN